MSHEKQFSVKDLLADLASHIERLKGCRAELEKERDREIHAIRVERDALFDEAEKIREERDSARALVEQLAGACEAAIRLSDKYLDSAGRTKECQKVYDMNATALSAAAAYRKGRG